MWLRQVEAVRLRNLRAVQLRLRGGLTVIVGRNGQGKTSLLEAIYLLGTGRSFRTRKHEELVSWDGGPMRVGGDVDHRTGHTTLAVLVDDGTRRLVVEGSERELDDFLGRFDVIDLTAERMKVLRGAPVERRNFLDRGVVGLRPSFLSVLGRYRRLLQQRNALLRQMGGTLTRGTAAQLDAWEERLAAAALEVHRGRRDYAASLRARLAELGDTFFSPGAELKLGYRPSPELIRKTPVAEIENGFREALVGGRQRDVTVGHTCIGPHRDDVAVELDGVDLRKYGSAGQVRAAMVALKLGKLAILREDRGEAPVFLMDDFDSHLDETRAAALADHLHRQGFQAIVATSKEAMADRLGVEFDKVVMDGGKARQRGCRTGPGEPGEPPREPPDPHPGESR